MCRVIEVAPFFSLLNYVCVHFCCVFCFAIGVIHLIKLPTTQHSCKTIFITSKKFFSTFNWCYCMSINLIWKSSTIKSWFLLVIDHCLHCCSLFMMKLSLFNGYCWTYCFKNDTVTCDYWCMFDKCGRTCSRYRWNQIVWGNVGTFWFLSVTTFC